MRLLNQWQSLVCSVQSIWTIYAALCRQRGCPLLLLQYILRIGVINQKQKRRNNPEAYNMYYTYSNCTYMRVQGRLYIWITKPVTYKELDSQGMNKPCLLTVAQWFEIDSAQVFTDWPFLQDIFSSYFHIIILCICI